MEIVNTRGLKLPKNIFFSTCIDSKGCVANITEVFLGLAAISVWEIGGTIWKISLKLRPLKMLHSFSILAVGLSEGSFFRQSTSNS